MNILITGGEGFIGKHLRLRLIKAEHCVITVDKQIGTDILRACDIRKIFETYSLDLVVHLAANSDISKGIETPEIDLMDTFLTTFQVLTLMKEFNVPELIFASSSAIFGETAEIYGENGSKIPISHYGAAKVASEAFISSFVASSNLRAWILRFPNVVGLWTTHGVILDFIHKLKRNPDELEILGDGTQCKPYLHVEELIDAILYIWRRSSKKLNIYNIGPNSTTTVEKIAKIIIEEMRLNPKIRSTGLDRGWIGDVPSFSYDTYLLDRLGWVAKLSSDEAIRKATKEILHDYNTHTVTD